MLKMRIKAALLACMMTATLAAGGCADTTWAVKVDNVKVPAGVYISFLYLNREKVMALSESSSSSSSSSGTNVLNEAKSSISGSSASSSQADPWSQKIEGENAFNWSVNNAVKSCEELAMAEKLCSQKNITLSSDESSGLSSYTSELMSYYSGFKSNGVSSASLSRMLKYNSYLVPKLIEAYYGKNGEQPVSDKDLSSYYTANYADIRQIFFTTTDDSGNALPTADQNKIKAQATEVYNEVKADIKKFDTLLAKYNQDPGMTSSPGGYIFNKDNTQYYANFVSTAFEMKVGDVRLIQTDAGWHIMYRVTTDPKASTFNDNMKENVLEAMKSGDLKKLLDSNLSKAKVTKNSSTINRYSPKKLKDS